MINFYEFEQLLENAENKKPKCKKCGGSISPKIDLYNKKTFVCLKCGDEQDKK